MDHMDQLFESAAKLQEIEPSAVLVGGTAATFHAHHRYSYDHDHVVQDLQYRYDIVLDNLSHLDGWTTNARVTKPPMTIMGDLDGYQAGLRNLRRKTPLEVEDFADQGIPNCAKKPSTRLSRCCSLVRKDGSTPSLLRTFPYRRLLRGVHPHSRVSFVGTRCPTIRPRPA